MDTSGKARRICVRKGKGAKSGDFISSIQMYESGVQVTRSQFPHRWVSSLLCGPRGRKSVWFKSLSSLPKCCFEVTIKEAPRSPDLTTSVTHSYRYTRNGIELCDPGKWQTAEKDLLQIANHVFVMEAVRRIGIQCNVFAALHTSLIKKANAIY
ncbi:hypothetical protein VP01_496g1 [Puccinia sorghi]|uniref:Uncharacterized protein n=1 Tax=Puccinia sorghi TaxID=27349 RepID=A0A0L6UMM2_9BASI|nr:hypothetical protein VP01_496g1 [Puccinia sorghi]